METEETKVTSDDALNQAAEQVASESPKSEETVSETIVAETKKSDEETDQQFRSRLGRRVSKLEDNINSFITEMRSSVQNLQSAPAASNNSDNTGEYVSTPADVKRIVAEVETEKLTKIRRYEDNYLNQVARLSLEEGLSDAEIMKCEELIKTSFNQTYSNYQDPTADAERNFLKAMRVIDKSKGASKQINLKGDSPKGTGVNVGAKIDDETIPEIKLDKYAQDLVNYYKMPPEKVAKAFKEKV
mgnify:CR=1 FL=1